MTDSLLHTASPAGLESTARARNRGVDILRGLAILWITIGHLGYLFSLWNNIPGGIFFWDNIHIPVYVFMLLSGYYIAKNITSPGFSALGLLRSKAIRLLPSYIVMVFAVFLIQYILPNTAINSVSFKEGFCGLSGLEENVYMYDTQTGLARISNKYTAPLTKAMTPAGPIEFWHIESKSKDRTYLVFGNVSKMAWVRPGELLDLLTSFSGRVRLVNLNTFQYKYKPRQFYPYLFLYQTYDNGVFVLHHTWYVGAILHFFIIVIFLLSWIRMLNSTERGRMRALAASGAAIILALLVFREIYGIVDHKFMTHRIIDIPFYGVILWLILRQTGGRKSIIAVIAFAGIVLIGWHILDDEIAFRISMLTLGIAMSSAYVLRYGDVPVVLGRLIAPIAWAGRYSYGIYIWHWPLSMALIFIFRDLFELNVWISFALVTVIVIVFGAASEKVITRLANWLAGTRGNKDFLELMNRG